MASPSPGPSSSPSPAGSEGRASPESPRAPPTNEDIEAVIKAATSLGTGPDGRPIPLKDTRTQLFVGNLPYRVRWQDLKDLFRKAGTVLRADVSLGPDNRSRGYGTVLLATAEDAGRAIDMFNGYNWQTRTLEVRPDRIPPADFDNPHGPVVPNSGMNMGLGAVVSPYGATASGNNLQFNNSPFSSASPNMFGSSPPAPSTAAVAAAAAAILAASGMTGSADSTESGKSDLEFPGAGGLSPALLQTVSAAAAAAAAGLERPRTTSTSGRNLFVGNLPFHCQWQDLKDLFRQAGTIMRADVALGPDGRSRGFGTVVFATEADADRAVNMFNGFSYNGRTLKVHRDRYSQPPSSSSSPNPMATTANNNNNNNNCNNAPLFSSPLASVPPRISSAAALAASIYPDHSVLGSEYAAPGSLDLNLLIARQQKLQHQQPAAATASLEYSPPPGGPTTGNGILGPMDIPTTSTAFPAARAASAAKLSPPDTSLSTLNSKRDPAVSPLLASFASSTSPSGSSPLYTASSAKPTSKSPPASSASPGAQSSSLHQNPRHPGTIALPPPPPMNTFPIPPPHTISPQALVPQFSPLHHHHHSPMVSPLHHPAHLAMMTPHGLPPITPSMPPFSFAAPSQLSPLPSPHHAVFPMHHQPPHRHDDHQQTHGPSQQHQHPLAQMHTPRRESIPLHQLFHHGAESFHGLLPSSQPQQSQQPQPVAPQPQHPHRQPQQPHPYAHLPAGIMSPFTPGLVLSPGGFWDGRHPFINPAPGAPVLMSPPMFFPHAQQEDGYFPSIAPLQQQQQQQNSGQGPPQRQNPPESYFPLLPPPTGRVTASSQNDRDRGQASGVGEASSRAESDTDSRSRSRSDDEDEDSSRDGAFLSSVATSVDVHGDSVDFIDQRRQPQQQPSGGAIDVLALSKRFEMLASRLVGEKERDVAAAAARMSHATGPTSGVRSGPAPVLPHSHSAGSSSATQSGDQVPPLLESGMRSVSEQSGVQTRPLAAGF